jgi:hypothetical protein
MSITIMSVAFGRTQQSALTGFSVWMGRLKVKPGSRLAAGYRPPSR